MGNEIIQAVQGYAIFIDTICEGRVPLWRAANGQPVFYVTRAEAEHEIVDDLMTRLQEYLTGEREFEDAIAVEEYVLPVERLPDGVIVVVEN